MLRGFCIVLHCGGKENPVEGAIKDHLDPKRSVKASENFHVLRVWEALAREDGKGRPHNDHHQETEVDDGDDEEEETEVGACCHGGIIYVCMYVSLFNLFSLNIIRTIKE